MHGQLLLLLVHFNLVPRPPAQIVSHSRGERKVSPQLRERKSGRETRVRDYVGARVKFHMGKEGSNFQAIIRGSEYYSLGQVCASTEGA